jgi:predicted DNA-binding protein
MDSTCECRTRIITSVVSPTIHQKLKYYCRKTNIPISTFVRNLIEREVEGIEVKSTLSKMEELLNVCSKRI